MLQIESVNIAGLQREKKVKSRVLGDSKKTWWSHAYIKEAHVFKDKPWKIKLIMHYIFIGMYCTAQD